MLIIIHPFLESQTQTVTYTLEKLHFRKETTDEFLLVLTRTSTPSFSRFFFVLLESFSKKSKLTVIITPLIIKLYKVVEQNWFDNEPFIDSSKPVIIRQSFFYKNFPTFIIISLELPNR